ncbi:iron chelate uptake ABC transporter family permease subunit [uncultured Clostridium sp.]|uniref:FecCD family ABC transporter permease n=1 Tax=uncultured Clostridium sp. TaxID=59620 RepID=UPI0025F9C998|nr:iron chelate uptake ABC transporter family permease subunit [uncultured Clostridium sp.]
MESKKKKYYICISILCIFMLLCIGISASIGSSSVTVLDSFKIIFSKIPVLNKLIDTSDVKQVYEVIVWKVRLPRILQSSLVGGALAVVGCTFQAVFRNSLADPHILGISSGAALGATLAILCGITLNFFGIGIVSIFAFTGALLTVILVYHIGGLGGKIVVTNLLLTGTAISTMLSSIISLLMIYNREQLEKVYLWTLGSFSASNWSKVLFLAVVSLICVTVIFMFGRDLNIILTGDEAASSLGIDTSRIKNILIIISAVLVSASVSVSGTIGFVGLVIPHCMRLIVGSDHKILLPFSYFGGASFMIICDTIARTIAQPTEIPVGVITAFFGAPYFVYLLYRNTKNKKF